MTTVRLTKHQQRLLAEIWPGMPPAVGAQLTPGSVRNVALDERDIASVVGLIQAERARTGCQARRRRLAALAEALTSPVEAGP